MRAVLQDGPGKFYTTVPLPCASAAAAALGGVGACALEDFQALIAPGAGLGGDTGAWCLACGATEPLACRAARSAGPQQQVASAAAGGGGRIGGAGDGFSAWWRLFSAVGGPLLLATIGIIW